MPRLTVFSPASAIHVPRLSVFPFSSVFAVFVAVFRFALPSLSASIGSIFMHALSALPFTFVESLPMLRSSAFLSVSAISRLVPRLSALLSLFAISLLVLGLSFFLFVSVVFIPVARLSAPMPPSNILVPELGLFFLLFPI